MSIVDINNNELQYHANFPNDSGVHNIEIGAGKGFFGKKFFPNCYLTDKGLQRNCQHFTEKENYTNHLDEVHFIDKFYSLEDLSGVGKKFSTVIICNPRGIGFRDDIYSKKFLKCLSVILEDGGYVLVLSSNTNPFGDLKRAKRYINDSDVNPDGLFAINEEQDIDESHQFRQYNFYYQTCGVKKAKPNQLYTITKRSNNE